MTHFYERNIVEIKNIYTTFLINIITPLIYEGVKSVYQGAQNIEKTFIEKGKNDPNIENPGILKIFQLCLKDIPTLNQHEIETETNRIKEKSKCSEWFDQLVQAVIKSHIVLLTYNATGKTCKLVTDKLHEAIDVKLFIHKCYIECARIFYNYPELFWHQYSTLDIKRNQREAHELIKLATNEAIKKMLPIKLILQEYLSNDYIKEAEENINEAINKSQYLNLRSMVQRDLDQQHVVNIFDDGHHSKIIDSNDEYNIREENRKFEEELQNVSKNIDNDRQDNDRPDKISASEPHNVYNKINMQENNINIDENKDSDEKINNVIYLDVPKPTKGRKEDFLVELAKNMNKNKEIKEVKEVKNNKHIDQSENEMSINVVRSVKGDDIGAFFEDYMN